MNMCGKRNDIDLQVKLVGQFAGNDNDREVNITVHNDVKSISKKIDELVIQRTGKKISYVLLINGINHSLYLKKALPSRSLKGGDVLTVVPIVIGG